MGGMAVSLFTREWIEICALLHAGRLSEQVSLFTREWIEISGVISLLLPVFGLPLYEGVD